MGWCRFSRPIPGSEADVSSFSISHSPIEPTAGNTDSVPMHSAFHGINVLLSQRIKRFIPSLFSPNDRHSHDMAFAQTRTARPMLGTGIAPINACYIFRGEMFKP